VIEELAKWLLTVVLDESVSSDCGTISPESQIVDIIMAYDETNL